MSLSDAQVAEIRAFALEIAREAGTATLAHFAAGVEVEVKSDDSPVTIADREAEGIMRTRIEQRYPDHAILGEEYGAEESGDARGRWILDPIDGTFSFIHGVPLYSNLVAFEWDGEAVAGVINLPALDECVHAARGQGCTWVRGQREQAARVSAIDKLTDARLCVTSVRGFVDQDRYDTYERLLRTCKTDRGWCDAYGYALVATGRAEVMLDPIMSVWDIAALYPVLTEAGGTLTDWRGHPTHTAAEALATNSQVLDEVLRTIGGAA